MNKRVSKGGKMQTKEGGRFTIVVLFAACLLFFSWPFVSIVEDSGGGRAVIYLFFCWLAAIVGLWAYCRHETLLQENGRDKGDF
jgi:hypothetical protein